MNVDKPVAMNKVRKVMLAILKSMRCLMGAGLGRTGKDTGKEVLFFLESGDFFLSGLQKNRVSTVEARANKSTRIHSGLVVRYIEERMWRRVWI